MNESELRAQLATKEAELAQVDAQYPVLREAQQEAAAGVTAARAAVDAAKKRLVAAQSIAWRASSAREANRTRRGELAREIDALRVQLKGGPAYRVVTSGWQGAYNQ